MSPQVAMLAGVALAVAGAGMAFGARVGGLVAIALGVVLIVVGAVAALAPGEGEQ